MGVLDEFEQGASLGIVIDGGLVAACVDAGGGLEAVTPEGSGTGVHGGSVGEGCFVPCGIEAADQALEAVVKQEGAVVFGVFGKDHGAEAVVAHAGHEVAADA